MKSTKTREHGISLISLIITVMVLLILAVMVIVSAYKAKIIRTAVQGSYDYSKQAIEENRIFENTTNYVHSVADELKDMVNEWMEESENNV